MHVMVYIWALKQSRAREMMIGRENRGLAAAKEKHVAVSLRQPVQS